MRKRCAILSGIWNRGVAAGVLGAMLLGTVRLWAADYTWVNTSSGPRYWIDSANWSPFGVPAATDSAYLTNASGNDVCCVLDVSISNAISTVSLANAACVTSLVVTQGVTGTVLRVSSLNLDNGGRLEIDSGGMVTNSGSFSWAGTSGIVCLNGSGKLMTASNVTILGTSAKGVTAQVMNSATTGPGGFWDFRGKSLIVGIGSSGVSNVLSVTGATLSNLTVTVGGSGAGASCNTLLINPGGTVCASSVQAGVTNSFYSTVAVNGGMLEANTLVCNLSPGVGNAIINTGGVYQFTTATPSLNPGVFGHITLASGTVSFRSIANANVKCSLAGQSLSATNILAWSGTNAFRLNCASNTTATSQSYIFDTGRGATNFARLEMVNGATCYRGTTGDVLTIGSGGSMVASNTTAFVNMNFVCSGELAVINSILTFTNNFTLNAGGTVVVDMNSLASTSLSVAGSLTFGSGGTLRFTGNSSSNGPWRIASASTIAGWPSTFVGLPRGYSVALRNAGTEIWLARAPTQGTVMGVLGPDALTPFAWTNTIPYAESFESFPVGTALTNIPGWAGSTNDLSSVTNVSYAYTNATLPLSLAAPTNVVCLHTQGDIVTNDINGFQPDVYLDVMVQMNPSATTPALASTNGGAQFLVFADASSNLTVWCRQPGSAAPACLTLPVVVDAGAWHRLTVHFAYRAGTAAGAFFSMMWDGQAVTSALAELVPGVPAPDGSGTWLWCATAAPGCFPGLGLQGDGYLDDLVVTSADPLVTNGVLMLAGNLAYGPVTTNTTVARTLAVCNNGASPLTVTNILLDATGFALMAPDTPFVLLPAGSTNLAVTFAPTATGPYAGTLMVLCDGTPGSAQAAISGTGMPVEALTTPVISGPAGGTLFQTNLYAVTVPAVDNWGYDVQYQFDWGDGSTSGWTSATSASHAWSAVGLYAVAAQSRSATNPSVLSAWSFPVSVTLTNTRVIGLGTTSLAFGSVATNANRSLTLTVTNSGNGPLTVFNIAITNGITNVPGYTVSPISFVLVPGAGTNVTVTFAPTTIDTYNGQLTVMSDACAGTTSVPVTGLGIPAESVSTPALIAVAGWTGNVGQVQAFVATNGFDNYASNIQYQVDWGDSTLTTGPSQPSGSTLATSHVWSVASTYALRVRVWSVNGVTSAWSSGSSLVITNTRILGLSTAALGFGRVVTNTTSNLVLTIFNSGNGPLTISNLTAGTSFYAATPTNFVLQAGGSSNVTVAFRPTVPQFYADTLTVVSDATLLPGGNVVALSGTGLVAEVVSQPLVTPTSATGTLGQSLTFSASASDNWNNAVHDVFTWGDGSNSGWLTTTNAAAHAWNTAGIYTVNAQARSAANTAVLSVLSAPAIVTITNVYAVNVSPVSLVFGLVATNATSSLTLTVSNTGNGPLSVTAVNCPAGFSAVPQSFTVATNSVTNVVVTFAPAALGAYAGALTLAIAGPVGGTNVADVSGTGMAAETISAPQPAVLPFPNGSTGDVMTISNAVLAVDSWGATNLAYRYDTGDGQTSGWITAIATTHVWAVTNAYQVRTQARNVDNINVVSPWSSNVTVQISGPPLVAFSGVTNGLALPVAVSIGGTAFGIISNVALCYLAPGSSGTAYTPLTLATNAAGTWTNALPPLNPGLLNYYLLYVLAGSSLRYPAAGSLTASLTNYLGDARQQGFEGAYSTDGGSNYWTSSGWTGSAVQVFAMSRLTAPLNSSSNVMLFLDFQNAVLITPNLPAGIGKIYFETTMRSLGWSASFNVDISTNHGTNWFTAQSFTLSNTTNLFITLPVNIRTPAMVRWVRTSADGSPNNNNQIVFDQLAISPPPTDVTLSEYLYNPGYPNAKDPTHVRCIASDVDAVNAPSVNRRVSLYYQAQGTGWMSTNMLAITIAGVASGTNNAVCYDGVVPVSPAGMVSYYFKCDFDGYFYSNSLYGAASESQTPEYLASNEGRTVVAPYRSFAISSFRKDNSDLNLVTANPLVTPSEQAMSLVDDCTWQGLILMNKSGGAITNLAWLFSGNNYYASNAPNYTLAPEVWGDTNQDFPDPPLAGIAEPGATNQIQAVLQYDGFLVIRLNTRTGAYVAKRAVFQDFNNWQASQDYFEASAGLGGTITFTNDFSAWSTNAYPPGSSPTETFTNEPSGVWWGAQEGHLTQNYWDVFQAQMVFDRGYLPPNAANPSPQKTLYLAPNAQAQVWNTAYSLTTGGGVHNLTLCSRLSVSDPYPRYALCTYSSASWASPYRVVSTNRAQSISAGTNASLSLVLCYNGSSFDPSAYSFYELRLAQVTDTVATHNDQLLQLQLYRWVNGAPTPFYASTPCDNQTLTNTTPLTWDVTWSNTASAVAFSGTISRNGTTLFTISTNDTATSRLTAGGMMGFLCADAVPEIRSASACVRGQSTPFYFANGFAAESANWFKGGTRPTSTNAWWQVDTSAAPSGYLVRPLTSATVNVYRAASPGDSLNGTLMATVSIASLAYVTNTIAFNAWDASYVTLLCAGSDLPVVVNSVGIDPWRAITSGVTWDPGWFNVARARGVNYYNWTSKDQQYQWSLTEPGWAVLEGWIGPTNGSQAATFDRTRANPNLDQGLLSPVLSNGMGSVSFDATVLGGTSVYRVDRTVEGDLSNWVVVQTFTNTVADATAHHYVPIRTNFMGRIRIVQIPGIYTNGALASGSSSNAVLALDNLTAKDYPPVDETAWKAYNALIAQPYTNSITAGRDFPDSPSERRTCYLNNNMTNGVLTGEVLGDDNPYVQTPKVDTGIGEIDFWYRAWDTNAVRVTIKAAAAESVPAGQWAVLTNFTVTATNYMPLAMPVFDLADKVMRIYTQTNSSGRLCLDNILMTEPMRPGYAVTGVSLQPQQPLATNVVAVQAQIGRLLMNPSNICLYLSYHVGVDTWGYANWRGLALTAQPSCVTIPLQAAADGRTFATPAGSSMPQLPVDTVVQYVVWGTCDGMTGQPVFQGTNTFMNPAWYDPVDLNAQNAGLGWSPYYFVYSCPPGSVWFNEINYIASEFYDLNQEYIEIAGPTGTDVSNWRIDVISPGDQDPEEVWNSMTMPRPTIFQEGGNLPDQTIDGWSFLVWGDDTSSMAPCFNFLYPFGSTYVYLLPVRSGGLRLVRSNGAYEQRLVYGTDAMVHETLEPLGYVATDTNKDVLFASRAAPLELDGTGSSYTNSHWREPASGMYSPGAMNPDQHLPAQLMLYVIWSAIGDHGQQTGPDGVPLGSPLATIAIAAGASTSIVYTADQWFKIAAFATNNVSDPDAVGTTQFVWAVTSASQNYSNTVSFSRPAWTISQTVGSNGAASPAGAVAILNGDSTSIVYAAQEWFRIVTLTTNGHSVSGAAGQKTNAVVFRQVTGNIANVVSFDYAASGSIGLPTNVPTRWAANYGRSETTPFANDRWSLDTKYLLDIDPYTNETVAFGFTSVAITGTTAYLTLQLRVGDAPHSTVNGRVVLYSGNDLATNTWHAVAGSAVNGTNAFDVAGQRVFSLPLTNAASGFTHARIE